jgi:uncharacterized protein
MNIDNSSGETDLDKLHSGLSPQLHPDTFAYCTFPDFALPKGAKPICTVREREGLTAVLEHREALALGVAHTFKCRLVTLNVFSALHAVGLLASVTAALANAGIACNAVAGYHHDHLFVPTDRAQEAMQVLRNLASSRETAV